MGEKKAEKQKRILVTGGGGFLGKSIVRMLLKRGHRVTSFSRNIYETLNEMGVLQINGDIADKKDVEKAVQGQDVVFHTAAKAGVWGQFDDYFKTNVLGTQNILFACRLHRSPLLIHTSSPSVVFDGTDMEAVDESVPYPTRFHSPYPLTKAMAEQEVKIAAEKGLRTIILRPHLIWGPEDNHLVPRILARSASLRKIGDGSNKVDTTYIENAARAHIKAMQALEKNPSLSGNVYFISDDEPIGLWTMVDRILAAGGKPPVRRSIAPKTAFWIGAAMEWIYRTLRLAGEPQMTRFVAKELATSHWFDISSAKNDLGYSADVTIEEGLERLGRWLHQNKVRNR
jgi:nucleoside-diphosphate-sugar epimerase